MIYRPTDTFDLMPLWGPELHDLSHGCSLLPVAAEMRERDARRKARAARRRRSWLRRAAGVVRSILRRRDCGRTGPPEAVRLVLEERLAAAGQPTETAGLSTVYEALTHAQLVARGAGQTELADALYALFLLDLTGNLADVAPLVASVRASLQSAVGDDPDAVN